MKISDDLFDKLDELNSSLEPKLEVKVSNESDSLEIIHIFEIEISYSRLVKFKDKLSAFLSYDCVTISESQKINTLSEIEKMLFKYEELGYDEEKIKIFVDFKQVKFLPLKDKDVFYTFNFVEQKFIEQITSRLTLSNIYYLQEKIKVFSKNSSEISSQLYQVKATRDFLSQNLNKYTLENNFRSNSSLEIYPNGYPYQDINTKKRYTIEMLKLLSDRVYNDDSIVFTDQKTKVITISEINNEFGNNYEVMSNIIKFLIEESGKQETKRTLFKKNIIEFLNKKASINKAGISFWSKILDQVKMDYELFINEEVNKFNEDKRNIIREQFELSYQVSEKANEIKQSFINNIIYITGIFLSQFLITALNENDETYTIIAIVIATIIVSAILFINFINEKFKSYKNFQKKIQIINKHYPKLYLSEDNIINSLEDEVSNPEINKLRIIEFITKVIYIIMLLGFVLLLLYLTYQYGYFESLFNEINQFISSIIKF